MSSTEPGTALPWERGWVTQIPSFTQEDSLHCGQYVLQTLLTEYSIQVEKKINSVLNDSTNKEISRTILGTEKEEFEQLLKCLSSVAEHALPSILTALFQWHNMQITPIQDARRLNKEQTSEVAGARGSGENYRRSLPDEAEKLEKHELAIEFIFCLALIAVLPQLSVHPVSDEQIRDIENMCFKNFKRRDIAARRVEVSRSTIRRLNPLSSQQSAPLRPPEETLELEENTEAVLLRFSQQNLRNGKDLTDLYAEVLGVLSEARFQSVIRKFKHEINLSYYSTQTVINIINGMRFIKLKLYPMEALQASFEFMSELADFFLDAKEKETRHSYAGLIVGLLVPVAAVINREVNVPVTRNFVEKIYQSSLTLASRKAHAAHLYDLITIILSVSQKQFFLSNWPIFLQMCISGLRTRDLSKISFNCIYRLVWVYIVRIKCESNNSTNQRLSQIIEAIFPKGSRNIIPRDGIQSRDFIQLIQIIALEKLDYVMKEVIYDLLCVNNRKMITSIYPERMNIGLNAFLAIANHLEKKDPPPPMPGSNFSYPSEAFKKKQVQTCKNSITDEIAESIGVGVYLVGVRKALEGMLHNLEIALAHIHQTNPTYANKNNDEILQGERKQKVQLLKSCIGAMPRIIPDTAQKSSLITLIARLTTHIDQELCFIAYDTLRNMIHELPRWRLNVVGGYLSFMQSIPHNYPDVMDKALRRLCNFISIWRETIQQDAASDKVSKEMFQTDEKFYENILLIHKVEGMAIVMLCSCSLKTKSLAFHLLEEARKLFDVMVKHFRQRGTYFEDPVMTKFDEMASTVIKKCLQIQLKTRVPKAAELKTLNQFVFDECKHHDINSKEDGTRANLPVWLAILFGMLHELVIKKKCASAIYQAFLIGSTRFQKLHTLVEASLADPGALSRTGIGRSRRTIDKADMCLWRNLMILCCKAVRCPSKFNKNSEIQVTTLPHFASMKETPMSALTAGELFKRIIALLRNESVDAQEIAVTALGASNPDCFSILVNCMDTYLGEILGGRTETVRRRRRRENLRLQVSRVYELCADNGCFKKDNIGDMGETIEYITQYIDHTKSICEEDKDSSILTDLKYRFCEFIRKMIISSDSTDLNFESLAPVRRMELFRLFRSWCHHDIESLSEKLEKNKLFNVNMGRLNTASLLAMCALLNAGPISENDLRHNNNEILNWLNYLLGSDDKYMHNLGCQVTEMLLLNNPEKRRILHWVTNQCYLGSNNIALGCFLALVRVLANCDFPCQLIPTIVLTLYMSAHSETGVREKATYLLQLIVNRFFKEWRDDNQHKLLKTDSHVMLSRQLSIQHKEISLPVFQEIINRFNQSNAHTQKVLLQILAPWLGNIEFVEYQLLQLPPKHLSKTKCVGSVHGSLLVFTNLMWITIKKNLEHEAELQELWGELMTHPANARVILNYIITLASLGAIPNVVLPEIKKVVMYMCRYKPGDMIRMLVDEVDRENIKAVSQLVEREDCPPYFYHIYMLQKHEKGGMVDMATEDANSESRPLSPRDNSDNTSYSRSSGDLNSQEEIHRSLFPAKSLSSKWTTQLKEAEQKHYCDNIPPYLILADDEDDTTAWAGEWVKRSQKKFFNPLPLPSNGGNLGQLLYLFPPTGPDIQILRCNFAIILLCDIVLDQSSFDWTDYLPLLLHISFLGFDHSLWLVHEHCKKLMLNLIHAFIEQSNPQLTRYKLLDAVNFPIAVDSTLLRDLTVQSEFSINAANAVIDCKLNLDHYTSKFSKKPKKPVNQTAFYKKRYPSSDALFEQHVREMYFVRSYSTGARSSTVTGGSSQDLQVPSDGEETKSQGSSHLSCDGSSQHPSEIHDEVPMGHSRGSTPTDLSNAVRKLYVEPEVLAERVRAVLKFMNTRDQRPLWNYEQITPFQLTIESFSQLNTFLALVIAVFDAVIDCDLKKSMCEESLQWAVNCCQRHYAGRSFEIFRCLQEELPRPLLLEVLRRLMENICDPEETQKGYVVECLLTIECSAHLMFNRIHSVILPKYKSKTDTIKRRPIDTRRHSSWDVIPAGSKVTSKQHLLAGSTVSDDTRARGFSEHNNNLRVKAYSLTSFRDSFPTLVECIPHDFSLKDILVEDDIFNITRMFWCCVCMAESDYEHEFNFAIRLMTSVLNCISVTDNYTNTMLEKVLEEINWCNFPGVIHLFLKGLPTQDLCENTLELLSHLLPFCNRKIFSGAEDTALPLTVLSLLPRLVINFSSPDDFCKKVAEDVVILCRERENLTDLGKVMTMYIDSTYPKNCQMWVGVVCKYINDAYINQCSNFLTFLVNILQNGPYHYHQAILRIVYESIKHIFLNHNFIPIQSPRVLQVLAKHEFISAIIDEQNILKLIISHSSSISLPGDAVNYRASLGAFSLFEHGLPELPGRSIQFKVDFKSDGSSLSGSQQSLVTTRESLVPSTNWRRPHGCLRKCRDRLASLLKISGKLEETNSLVFSAASDCEISKEVIQSTSSSDSISVAEQLSQSAVNQSISSIPDDTSSALHQFDFLNDENTADEGNDTDSINSSWRGGLNNSSYTHSRNSSIDSYHDKPRFKSLPHIQPLDDSDISSESERSESRNDTLKRPRSSISPHSSRFNRSRKEVISEVESDLSSPDGPDTATPKLPDDDCLAEGYGDEDDSDSEYDDRSSTPGSDTGVKGPALHVHPPSPQKSPTDYGPVEFQWLDAVSKLVTSTSRDIDSTILLVFQRILKSHLLNFRRMLTLSIKQFYMVLPEEITTALSNCLETFNTTEVPFIFLDEVLLNSAAVKDRFRFYIFEAREKVEFLAKNSPGLSDSIASMSTDVTNLSAKQNLRLKERYTRTCVEVQKLHFYFCALYTTFSRIVDLISGIRKRSNEINDLSDSISDLASRLFQASMNPEIASLGSSGGSVRSRDNLDMFSLDPLPEAILSSSPKNTNLVHVKHTKLSRSRTSSRDCNELPAKPPTTLPIEPLEQPPEIKPEPKPKTDNKSIGTGSLAKIMKKKKKNHRRNYSESHIKILHELEGDGAKSYMSQHNLASYTPTPEYPPTSENDLNLSQIEVEVDTGGPSSRSVDETGGPSSRSVDEDTVSTTSEIPPLPDPFTPGVGHDLDLPLPEPPPDAYYTSPQITRKEFDVNRCDIEHLSTSFDLDNVEIRNSFYNEDGELKFLDKLKLEENVDKRSRKGSVSNTNDSISPVRSRTSSDNDVSRNTVPIPGSSFTSDLEESTFVSAVSSHTVTGHNRSRSSYLSPSLSQNYAGIMSCLTQEQTIVFIGDHLTAGADTSALDTLHQARSRFGPYLFGRTEKEDVTVLLGILCQLSSNQSKLAVWGSGGNDLECSGLMSDSIMLEGAINNFT